MNVSNLVYEITKILSSYNEIKEMENKKLARMILNGRYGKYSK